MTKKAAKIPLIWVLKTPNTGDTNNRMAIAKAASPLSIPVDFSETGNSVEQFLLRHYGVQSISDIRQWPDIFITCEQETYRYAADLKRLSRGKIFIAGLQTPSIDKNDLNSPLYRTCVDMQILFRHHTSTVAALDHDSETIRKVYGTVPTYITPHHLDAARLGGDTRKIIDNKTVYTLALGSIVHAETKPEDDLIEENLEALLKSVAKSASENQGCVLLTTSRRTGRQFMPIIREELKNIPHYVHDWAGSEENPYVAMLAAADRVIVSGDSISMVSDALATGKPVHVYAPSARPVGRPDNSLKLEFLKTPLLRSEIKLYMSRLAEDRLIHPLAHLGVTMESTAVNSAGQIARDLLAHLFEFKSSSKAFSSGITRRGSYRHDFSADNSASA